MIERFAKRITDWLVKTKSIDVVDKELYQYAVQSLLLTVLPIIMSIVIGLALKAPLNGLLVILPFSFLRKYCGGYHAKKEATCLVFSSLLLFLCVALSILLTCSWVLLAIACVMGISLICFSPIENENRLLDDEERVYYKRVTVIMVGCFIVVNLLFFLFKLDKYSICISIGIILPACLQIPCIIEKIICKNDQKW